MRLCFVSFEYPPVTLPSSGGVGSWVSALAPSLAARGHEVHVLTSGGERARTVVHESVTVHVSPPWRPRRDLPVARTAHSALVPGMHVRRELRRLGRFDLIVAPEWSGEAWLYALDRAVGPLLTQLGGPRRVLAPYTGSPDGARAAILNRLQDMRERTQVTASDAVVACSTAMLGRTRETWPLDSSRTFVVPNSVDVARVRRLGTETVPPLQPGPLSVAFTGRLEPRKGIGVLVPAMVEVWRELPDVELILIGGDCPWPDGSGSAIEHVRMVAGPHADRVHVLGSRHQAELFAVLSRASLVATPSLFEPFGLATLEAMALGIPVVATSGSGFSEFVRDGQDGLLVTPGAAGELAHAIRMLLLDSGERSRMGNSAARRALEFDVAPVASRHEQVFTEVAHTTRRTFRRSRLEPARVR